MLCVAQVQLSLQELNGSFASLQQELRDENGRRMHLEALVEKMFVEMEAVEKPIISHAAALPIVEEQQEGEALPPADDSFSGGVAGMFSKIQGRMSLFSRRGRDSTSADPEELSDGEDHPNPPAPRE